MQKICTIFLILALSVQLLAKLEIIALYKINKDYISQNLCENRARPKLECNGKCYLKKQLDKTEDESSNPGTETEAQTLIFFLVPTLWSQSIEFIEPVLAHNTGYTAFFNSCKLTDIFHPPDYLI